MEEKNLLKALVQSSYGPTYEITDEEKFRKAVSENYDKISQDNLMSYINELKSGEDLNNRVEILKSVIKIYSEEKARHDSFNDALFFPSESNEIKLVNYIRTAKQTLFVCVFTITNNNLADALYLMFKRGVDVQIISDDECAKTQGSDIYDLANAGIEIRLDNNQDTHMHNKFAVIDSTYLINGSFNWTTQAVNGNQENVSYLENKALSLKYETQFYRLWEQFKDNKVEQNGDIIYRFQKMKI